MLRLCRRAAATHATSSALPAVQIAGTDTEDANVPVRNVWCIGRNYALHALELGNQVPKEEPVVFLKSSSAVRGLGPGPLACADETFHHEVELVALVGSHVPLGGLPHGRELECVTAVGLGLDLTRRGKQSELKKGGLPWTVSKSFAGAAVLSPFVAVGGAARGGARLEHADLGAISFELGVNGDVRQTGHVDRMLFPLPFQLRHVNSLVPLLPGDLFFTGTPEGVGPIRRGDKFEMRFLGPTAVEHLRFEGELCVPGLC